MIKTLMVFAAGFGARLHPLTKTLPKPLIEIAGKPLLYYALDLASHFKFEKIIINTHYLNHLIEEMVVIYVEKFKPSAEIILIHEPNILETGGAIKNAQHLFENQQAIFTINSDSIISTTPNIWHYMLQEWNGLEMDFMLLLTNVNKSFGTTGKGDFDIDSNNMLHRRNDILQFMFSGLQIVKPELIANNPLEKFSLVSYYKDPEIRLRGYINQGNFYHISNLADYAMSSQFLPDRN
jgi:MurNAc alpha-1-phosphate uridylyltransferase